GDGIYYHSAEKLWVSLYAPSTAEWTDAGVSLEMKTDFPEGESAFITLAVDSPREFTLALRRPSWAGEDFTVKINGVTVSEDVVRPYRDVPESGRPVEGRDGVDRSGTYVELTRIWKTGDTVEIFLPKTLRLEPVPDNPKVTAIMWGPLVLAADFTYPVIPVFVAAGRPVSEWIEAVPDSPGRFRVKDVGRDSLGSGVGVDVDLLPFYRLHRRTYAVYFDLFTEAEWEEKKAGHSDDPSRSAVKSGR
ncbi:MAG: glycoside hydrolase family 127 protein, partial [Acidobacteria bacterium]|nr:glycoside hydrolase family 127 protein [Acidobacteriota bacterium]